MHNDDQILSQFVEYLGLSAGHAQIGAPPQAEPAVFLTIRPDLGSFCPHNLCLSRAQAERLHQDLGAVLKRALLLLAIGFLAATTIGCGARVEVEADRRSTPVEVSGESMMATSKKTRAVVEVGLMTEGVREPVSEPHATKPEPQRKMERANPQPSPPPAQVQPITVSNTLVINVRGGDTVNNHYETRIEMQESPSRQVEERATVRPRFQPEPPRPVDPRCERLRREHEARVRRWIQFPGR